MIDFDKIATNWNFYTYPWRPNIEVLEILKPYLEGNKALVLGSTKEFRKLLYSSDKNVFLSDLSNKMIKVNNVGNIDESIIENDWFNIKGKEFDIILGDLVLVMYKLEDKIKLVSSLLSSLDNDGCIILRLVVKKENTSGLINKILLKNKSLSDNDFFNYLSFELVNGLGLGSNEIYKILLKYSANLGEKYNKTFRNITPYNGMVNHCLSNENFQELNNKFNIDILNKKTMVLVDEYIIKVQ